MHGEKHAAVRRLNDAALAAAQALLQDVTLGIAAGERIGTRADGTPVVAPFAGMIVFPNPAAETGQEWFYLAKESERLGP